MEIHEKMQSTDSNSYIEWEEEVEFAQKLPKIELHLHLDGSLSPGNFELFTRAISRAWLEWVPRLAGTCGILRSYIYLDRNLS